MQLGVIKTKWNESDNISFRYYSKEHEDFVYTAIQIFRENIFKGSGVKTFYKACNDLKNDKSEIILENDSKLSISFYVREDIDINRKNISLNESIKNYLESTNYW